MSRLKSNRIYAVSVGVLALLCNHTLSAQGLDLAELPASCRYVQNLQQPFTDPVNISAAAPVFSAIGDSQREIIAITVQCEGPTDSPVTFSIKQNGALTWAGPGRDILATHIPGVGIRLLAEAQSDHGYCSGSEWLSSGKAFSCSLSDGGVKIKTMSLRLKAQLVKTDNNTPIHLQQALRLAGGNGIALVTSAHSEQSINIFEQGLLIPTISTTPVCTLVTEQNHNINFGQVYRPKSEQREITLGLPQETSIEVSCLPLRDYSVNDYQVKVTFNTTTLYENDATALATGIDDIAIRFSKDAQGMSWGKFGEKYNLQNNPVVRNDKSHFAQNWYWFLRYMPKGNHQQIGNFNTVATYTVTIE
ncbi:hypothetical protein [Pantoea dispersa]|uniref:hypothetical protein n=1 Tax=Pantoea dispersa TaxID=59814 RepID=UPI0039B63347